MASTFVIHSTFIIYYTFIIYSTFIIYGTFQSESVIRLVWILSFVLHNLVEIWVRNLDLLTVEALLDALE